MGKPTFELLPSVSPLIPAFIGQPEAISLFFIKQIIKLSSGACIYDYRVFLVIPTKASCIQISTTHCTNTSIYCYNLCMMKPRFVHPHYAPGLCELAGIVEATIWRQRNITLDTQHDFYLHAPTDSSFQCFLDAAIERKIWINQLYTI